MGKICEFFVFVSGVVWIAMAGMVAWSAYPQTIKDVTLISQSGEALVIPEAKYSRLFRTITYTEGGKTITLDAKQYRMEQRS